MQMAGVMMKGRAACHVHRRLARVLYVCGCGRPRTGPGSSTNPHGGPKHALHIVATGVLWLLNPVPQ